MNGPAHHSDSCSHLSCNHDDDTHHGHPQHAHDTPHSPGTQHSQGTQHSHDSQHAHAASISLASHVPEEPFSRVVGFMDIAGVFASSLCTVHCLLLPIVVVLLPVIAKHMMHHDYVHIGLAGFVLTFCLMAYVPGYLKHHDKRLIWIGAVGISLVFFATFVARQWGEVVEASVITAGNTCIICGHLLNRKLLAHLKCKHY